MIVRTARGSSVHIEDTGGGRVSVLALHGLGGGAYFFDGLASRLSPRYRVVAIDMPGTGRSTSGVNPWSIDSWIDDLADLIAAYIREPVVVVGHSLGTIVALALYRAWPQHVRGLVFVGGLPKPRSLIVGRLTDRAAEVRRAGLSGVGAQVAQGVFSPATFRRRPEIAALFARVFEAQSTAAYLRGIDVLVGASAEAIVPTVGVPCLAITGADDQYAPPGAVKAFVESIPSSPVVHVIPECGHMPFFEAPEEFATQVEAFLDRL